MRTRASAGSGRPVLLPGDEQPWHVGGPRVAKDTTDLADEIADVAGRYLPS